MISDCDNKEKCNSLRFYQGDTSWADEVPLKSFYSTKSAYMMLNSLMYDGIENEKARICDEKKKLQSHLLLHIREIIKVYKDIFFLMKQSKKKYIRTYRAERKQALEPLKGGYTVSLTSTSKKKDLGKAFQRKCGLLVLEFIICENVPYIDMNEVLGIDNLYSSQEEILLPPFLKISMEAKELNTEELDYKDIHRLPPVGKYQITVSLDLSAENIEEVHELEFLEFVCQEHRIQNAIRVIDKMNAGHPLDDYEVISYVAWKKDFQKLIKNYFVKLFL